MAPTSSKSLGAYRFVSSGELCQLARTEKVTRKGLTRRIIPTNSWPGFCLGQCALCFPGIISLNPHDDVMREQFLFPFCRWRSWGSKRWSTVLVYSRASPQTHTCLTPIVDKGLHLNLAMREKIITASSKPPEHTCVISYILFIPKLHTLKKNTSAPL